MSDQLSRPVQRLRALMDYKDKLEEKLKSVNKEIKELKERIIPKIMEDGEIEKAKIEAAGSIYIKQELYVSMTKSDDGEPPFYDWAREHAPTIIVPYIHPKRLQSFCKDRLENGLALPDNMIKASFVPTATLLRR